MVVPIREEAFAAARKLRVYAVPIARSTSDVSHVAFYRGAPTSAITHIAKVEGIFKNLSFSEVFPSGSAILIREDQPLKVYHLGAMEELGRRVKKGKNPPISGPRYTKLDTLNKARYLDEVWPPDTTKGVEAKRSKAGAKAKKDGPPPKERVRRGRTDARKDGKRPKSKARGDDMAPKSPSPSQEPEPPKKRRRRGGKRAAKEADTPKAEAPKADDQKAKDGPERKKRKRGSRGKGKKKADEKSESSLKPSVTYIIDGSNVALEARSFKEGGRLRQIELIIEKLEEEDGAVVTVIIDANLRHHIDRKDELEVMIQDRRVLQAPAQTDADEFILLTAESHRARGEKVIIISNDRYQDYLKRFKPRFDWVKDAHRRFMFVFSPDGSEALEAMVSLN